jgi:hypothetical protein
MAQKQKQKQKYLQEPLFPEMKEDLCYVCYTWIRHDGVYIGNGMWRHQKCKPKEYCGKELHDAESSRLM